MHVRVGVIVSARESAGAAGGRVLYVVMWVCETAR